MKVWDALRVIPYGETRCYQEVAEAVGNPEASRAVGMANNRNPVLIMIPCHRVIGKSGKPVGYAGGVERKESLLKLEANLLNKLRPIDQVQLNPYEIENLGSFILKN